MYGAGRAAPPPCYHPGVLVPLLLAFGPLGGAAEQPGPNGDAATVTVEIRGWRENPVATPEVESFEVELLDQTPLVLEDELVKVVQCEWKDGSCTGREFPVADDPADFEVMPPALEDVDAHRDDGDPFVALAVMQYLSRVQARFRDWGWDGDPWELIDCSWQGVEKEDCKLWVYVNAKRNGEEGPEPYNGANAPRGGRIFLGQGEHGDTGFDMQLVAHEFTHFVGWGFPESEPIDYEFDWSFWRFDYVSISEGTADLFARFLSESDDLYQYFRYYCGLYSGSRSRDISLDFQCPQNVTGEVHMEGRIWAATWFDVHLELQEAGLAGPDDMPAVMLAALPGLRALPIEYRTQFPQASELVLEQVAQRLGSDAEQLARELATARGLIGCDYLIDVAREPSARGVRSPSPVDARFLMLKSHPEETDPAVVDEQPWAPPVQHLIELEGPRRAVTLRFVPDRWHRLDTADEPLDQEGLHVAALVKAGTEPIVFARDPETGVITNDAQWRIEAESDPERGPTWQRIDFDELEPDSSYTVALVSLTPLAWERVLLDDMQWTFEQEYAPAYATGCACASNPTPGSAWWLVPLALLGLRRRH